MLKNTDYNPRTLRACFTGLVLAQIIGSVQVYLSNRALHRTISAVLEAGYVGVPNDLVLPSLLQLKYGIIGGLFFTLSIGSALTLLAWTSAWLWNRIFRRSRRSLPVFTVVWLVLAGAAAVHGFDLPVFLYFFLIPPAVFTVAAASAKRSRQPKAGLVPFLPFIGLLGLVLTWLPVVHSTIFVDLRDYLLMASPVGRMINDAYYDYTLYPAQVFKTLRQKTIKTVWLAPEADKTRRNRLVNLLMRDDYLPVPDRATADLSIRTSGENLIFQYDSVDIKRISVPDFLRLPDETLAEISTTTDRFGFFRLFTSMGVLIGFPIMLYIILHGLLHLAANLVLPPRTAAILAALAVFLAGILLALPLYLGKARSVDPADAEAALRSGQPQERISGLRAMVEDGRNPMKIVDIATVQKSFTVPERYWYVRAMGNSPETKPRDLEMFLDDQSLNVVCMAYDGLGRRGTHQLIGPLLEKLRREPHWYVQWYAYRTLRQIGWIQKDKLKIDN